MRITTKRLLCSFIGLIGLLSVAQTEKERETITSRMDLVKLQQLETRFQLESVQEKQEAMSYAIANNIAVRKILDDGTLVEIQRIVNGTPIYYSTLNVDAATSTRTNYLHSNGGLGLNIEGQNMTGYIWDGGLARASHQEYDGPGGTNRFSIGDSSTTLNYHAAHVTGTVIAYGAQPAAKGMAPRASAVGHDWNNDKAEATSQASNGMLLSNHSYGYATRDQFGNPQLPSYFFGGYIDESRDWDIIMYNAPYYLMVVAAGNDGNDNSANGAPLDGNASYDKLTGHAVSKNNLVVANANDANINSNGTLNSVSINSSSSEGPTDDLRIKPDITGNGTSVYSTYESSNTAYNSITGTSMASPNVMGSLLLLQQYHNSLNGSYMRAATLKGIALHTADDAGSSGPDAIYGWGLMNTKKAAETLMTEGTNSIVSELTLSSGQSYTIDVNASGLEDLKASISWTDVAGTATTTANSNTARLVNDLDIRVTKSGTTFNPWRLTGITSNGKGDNSRDPYERVDINNPSGTYTITITHKGSLSSGSQNYSLIVTGIAAQAQPCVASTPSGINVNGSSSSDASIGWNAVASATYQVRFRESGTTTWTNLATNTPSITINGLTATTSYQAQVRSVCDDGSVSAYSSSITFSTTSVQYCASNGNSVADEFIGRVQFNTIDQSSVAGAGGYTNYTNVSTNLSKGTDYTLTVTPTWTGTVYAEGYAAWIDFNQDGDFNDSGETVWTAAASQNTPASGSISIPNSALSGATRMRISMQYNAIPASCGSFNYGEVEDYTVIISNSTVDTTAPSAPSSLTSSNLTESTVDLNWTASTDNIGVIAYEVRRGTTVLTTTANTSIQITGLVIGTSYSFNIRAVDAAGNISSASNSISVTPTDQTAPSVPAGLSVTSITQNTATISWSASSDNIGVTSYDLYIDGSLLNNVTGTTASLTGLSAGTSYSVAVRAKDAAGNNSSLSSAVNFTTEATSTPGCVNAISLPYNEGYETGLGGWSQGTGDDFDWTRRSGSTPSSNTGPSSASQGSFYMYVEASAPNNTSKTTYFNSPCFDLTTLNSATMSFKYHMYGIASMGSLTLQASIDNGSSWSALWSRAGNQGNAWLTASIDLSPYTGNDVQLRFVGTTTNQWQGDIAIDDIALSSNATSTTANLSITFDRYASETSWSLANGNGTTIASGSGYDGQAEGSSINIPLSLPADCYVLTFNDSYGDGMCCSYGNGSYSLTADGTTLAAGGSFTTTEVTNFCVGGAIANSFLSSVTAVSTPFITIYPNPVRNGYLNIAAPRLESIDYSIINLQGQYISSGKTKQKVDVSDLPTGIYMIQIKTYKETIIKRFIVE
ncbi:peptidase S8 [Nonlabens arenilitoris]|uniref:Peptidase S8 n=1 Tax=Nonlabens arenilitoris TaxID=1217969 RepID=A0A2S7UC07_9FLAO|nr:GEVED domain-containing protein [Nonlabens arenilitoris]PQJ32150.1 peptidase S8 [Nonlabens arenilitoris]